MNENLPETIIYKGYQIKPSPRLVIVEGVEKWNTQFKIFEHKGSEVRELIFNGRVVFETKQEAIKYCFQAGKDTIDKEPEKLIKH